MEIFAVFLILLFAVVSSVVVWLNLPGTFLMAGFIFTYAWVSGFDIISLNEAMGVLGLVVFLELLEFLLGGLATRLTGASKRAMWGAILGGTLGTIILGSVFFILGALVGLFAGSYLGAFWGERRAGKSLAEARRAAWGALMGSVAAKVLKSAAVIVAAVWMVKELI